MTPKEYMVTVVTKRNGKDGLDRIGHAKSLADCHRLIDKNKQALAETYGGLIAPIPRKEIEARKYQIWRAKWEEILFA